jgi:putative membrane protein
MTGPDPAWRRLHPITPLLRGGRTLVVVAALAGQQGLRQADEVPVGVIGLLVLAAAAVGALVGLVLWRTTRYRLTDTELQIDSGLLTKRSRRVPLARLQSVDVVRPVVARVLGVAELRLEVVGGGSSEAPLAYLGEADAQQLRQEMLARAAGRGVAAAQSDDTDEVLVVVPTHILIASVLLGAPAVLLLGLIPLALTAAIVDVSAALAAGLAIISLYVSVLAVSVRRVLNEYGFTVAESTDGLRLRHGLLDTRAQTIPPGRVQAIRMLEPLLWRPWGWVRVEVDVAGYGRQRGETESTTSALLPVAPRPLAQAVIGRILGGGLPAPAAAVPARAKWRAPLSYRRLGAGVDDRHLVTTSGVLTTTTEVVPLAKIQSLRLASGPWQQRLRLATVHADTAGRRLPGAKAHHRDAEEAQALMAELSDRARAARRTAG